MKYSFRKITLSICALWPLPYFESIILLNSTDWERFSYSFKDSFISSIPISFSSNLLYFFFLFSISSSCFYFMYSILLYSFLFSFLRVKTSPLFSAIWNDKFSYAFFTLKSFCLIYRINSSTFHVLSYNFLLKF
jgi:hypothetical protein